ncbi:MAG: DUF3857 domain-containing protein [Pseudomonadota bacterium]
MPNRYPGTVVAVLLWSLLAVACSGSRSQPIEKFHVRHLADPSKYVDVDAVVLLEKLELTFSFSVKQWQPFAELVHHRRIHVLKPAALHLRKVAVPFDDTSGILDITARITHPDGSVQDLGAVPTLDFNRFAPGHRASGLYNAPAAKVFAAPDLQVGDVIEYRYRRVIRDASWVDPLRLGGPYPIERGEVAIIYPDGFDVDYRVLKNERAVDDKPQRLPERVRADPRDSSSEGVPGIKLLWVYQDLPALYPEPLRPADDAVATQVHVRFKSFFLGDRAFEGFRTWDDVARWYGRLIGDADAPDSSTERRVKEIGATTTAPKLERMRRINRWIADHVVPIDFDGNLAALKVHRASSILATGAGDAKDIASLALAMLRAAGVEAFPVLCARRGTQAVALDLPTPAAFNAVVVAVAVGGGYKFFAPDGYGLPTGRLPWQVQGSRGLLIRPSGAELVELPEDGLDDNRREIDIKLDLASDGSASGTALLTLRGQDAGLGRLALQRLEGASLFAFFQGYIVEDRSKLVVTAVQPPKGDDGDKALKVLATIVGPGLATPAGGGLRYSVTDLVGIPFSFLWREIRRTPVDVGFRFTERRLFSVAMPEGTGLTAQPPDYKRDSTQVLLDDRYAPADGRARMLRDRAQKVGRIMPSDYADFRSFYESLWQHQDSAFVIAVGGDRGVDYKGDDF